MRKPCAENLFLTLLQKYEQAVTALVVDVLQRNSLSPLPLDFHVTLYLKNISDVLKEPLTSDGAVLLREAVYNAVGLGQYELYLVFFFFFLLLFSQTYL
jgi:hypothetical protein